MFINELKSHPIVKCNYYLNDYLGKNLWIFFIYWVFLLLTNKSVHIIFTSVIIELI
jgi:hypothetical protein